jgi:hypothetical protein
MLAASAMTVLELIADVQRQVPADGPCGMRGRATATVSTPHGPHVVAVAARIDDKGRRREQFWCDGVRVERSALLRLTCGEAECPQARAVHAQWLEFHRRAPPRAAGSPPGPAPLIADIPVVIGHHRCVARPARFPCYTPCPHGAHPPMWMHKTGLDLFEDGVCLGGGLAADARGVMRPRLPTVSAAEAFVLARHLEALAALGEARESSRLSDGRVDEG